MARRVIIFAVEYGPAFDRSQVRHQIGRVIPVVALLNLSGLKQFAVGELLPFDTGDRG